MDLTPRESQVVTRLKELRVAQLVRLATQLDVSTKTVQRALTKAGYFSSINHNASFVTLRNVPKFDEQGLWSWQRVHFSRHGNLRETLVRLIDQASAGHTLQELEQLVGTHVHNHLSQLIREGRLGRFLWGRRAVYVASGSQQATRQQAQRRAAEPPPAPAVAAEFPAGLPRGLDAMTVIRVLVRLLEAPEASVASVARWLQARRVRIQAAQVRHILDFYGLKKTTR